MSEAQDFDFVNAEFSDADGQRIRISSDPASRITQIDAEISYLEFRNSRAEASYEERENGKSIQELREEKAQLMSELSDEQRENLISREKE
ncbi:MAG TPA: hypothetical protein VIK37_00045 [Candidatus Saccharimonadales bacterium]